MNYQENYLYFCPYDREWIPGEVVQDSPFSHFVAFLPEGEQLVIYVSRNQIKRHDRSEAV